MRDTESDTASCSQFQNTNGYNVFSLSHLIEPMKTLTLDSLLKSIEILPVIEQETLLQILQNRLTQKHRTTTQPRIPGQDKGQVVIAPDFNAPLPEDILNDFLNPSELPSA